MTVMTRLSDVVQEKLNVLLNRSEEPSEALDLAYQHQLQSVQEVRQHVADVLTAEKRLELEAAQMRANQQKLRNQAKEAVAQGREDLARLALTRAQAVQAQLDGLDTQVAQLKDQEQKLELTAQKLQAKVEAFRAEKETIKAQYSAAEASTKIGETVTSLSEQMADVSMMVDRAKEKTSQMQARAAAIDQLVDTGILEPIGTGGQDDIDRQLAGGAAAAAVEAQLQTLKEATPVRAALPAGTEIVRILGDDQYRISTTDRAALDAYDRRLTDAMHTSDASGFQVALQQAIEFVRTHGSRLASAEVMTSDHVLPAEGTTLQEAIAVLAPHASATREAVVSGT